MYEQKDYLMRQVEELGQVLAKIISSILSLKNAGNITNTYVTIQESFSKELDIDLEKMILLSEQDFIKFISDTFFDNPKILEILANILYEAAEHSANSVEKKNCAEKSLVLFERSAGKEKTFSFSHQTKINSIKNLIDKK